MSTGEEKNSVLTASLPSAAAEEGSLVPLVELPCRETAHNEGEKKHIYFHVNVIISYFHLFFNGTSVTMLAGTGYILGTGAGTA